MSKIALEGNSLGTGTFTIAAPNSNSSPTLTLPNSSGTVVVTGGAQTIEFAAGTVSAPSITTTGDTNTGIFFPAADTIAFTEGGVEAMRIDSSGRVGIGTTNPSSPLTISKSGSTAIEIPSGASVPVNAYGATTGASTFAVANTGGTSYFGNESSVGGTSFVGTLAYATCVGTSAAQALQFITNNTARATIDSSGNVGIGTTSPTHKLNIVGTNGSEFKITRGTNDFIISLENNAGGIVYVGSAAASPLVLQTSNTERARITSTGYVQITASVGTNPETNGSDNGAGIVCASGSYFQVASPARSVAGFNRLTDDGTIVSLRQAGTEEGTISVSGNIVSYNPFLGSHSGALADWSRTDIKIGTVMDTIDELLEYKVVVIDVQEEVPAKDAVLDEEGNETKPAQEATTQTVQKRISYNGNGAVGSSATVQYEGQEYTGTIEYERKEPLSFNKHLKVKINDTAASKAVFGVFVGWNTDSNNDGGVYNDMLVGAVGNYVIRMAAGQEPQIGDLVESDGNGCAVVQDDDVIRTKTVAKITSTIKQLTYDDGSFLVTCVLYCG